MIWTDPAVEQLKALWASGLSCSQIARTMGQDITRNAVIGKVHRLSLKGRKRVNIPRSSPARKLKIRKRILDQERFEEPDLDADPVVIPANVWAALPDTSPVRQEHVTGCCWPIGLDNPFTFCNAPIAQGSWCQAHARIGYRTVEKLWKTGKATKALDAAKNGSMEGSSGDEKYASQATPAATNETAVLEDGFLLSTRAYGAPA